MSLIEHYIKRKGLSYPYHPETKYEKMLWHFDSVVHDRIYDFLCTFFEILAFLFYGIGLIVTLPFFKFKKFRAVMMEPAKAMARIFHRLSEKYLMIEEQ